jgi:phage terminase small subunit
VAGQPKPKRPRKPPEPPRRGRCELTYKQRLFVHYYLGESKGNATDAARRAGYRRPNEAGPRLAVKGGIRARIDAQLAGPALAANEVLARLSEQASSSIEPFLRIDSRGRATLDLAKARKLNKLHLIKKLKRGKFGLEIELYDAQKALELLGKYHRLFAEKLDLGGPDDKPLIVKVLGDVSLEDL